MTITARQAQHLDELAVDVVANYTPARRQLEEWTGGYKASVIGASPPSTRAPVDSDNSVQLTTVERLATTRDDAQHNLNAMNTHLTRLAADGRAMWAAIDGAAIPEPTGDEWSRLAVMMWTVRRIVANRHAVSKSDVGGFQRRLEQLDGICRIHQPPPATRIVEACHAHLAATIETEASSRYRRHHLCRWCGDFRATYGVNPPPMLVRLHDRGIMVTPTHIRRAGVKLTA